MYDFHGLRHTFATLLNQAHVPLATAQKLMRHSDPKLTANIYTHVLVEGKAEALAKLPDIAAHNSNRESANKEALAATGTLGATATFGDNGGLVDANGGLMGISAETGVDTEMDTQVLAKLEAIIAEENNNEAVVPMEIFNGNTRIEGAKMDTLTDTQAPNFDGEIRT